MNNRLPQIPVAQYNLKIPSTGKQILYRPFLVKEEKIFLQASEGGDQRDMVNALRQVATNCILTEGIDVNKLPTFDLEYIFLKLRSKSTGEKVDLHFRLKNCPKEELDLKTGYRLCKNTQKVTLDLNKVEIKHTEGHTKNIELQSGVGLSLKYPTMEIAERITEKDQDFDSIMKLIINSIELIYDSKDTYMAENYTEKELRAFLEGMTQDNFGKIQKFFDTQPKLSHEIEIKCDKCSTKETITIEGLQNFFE